MSTVKIKTEPTAAETVNVQVKLESSLSTGDIKLEQHSSDIDTKVESDSEVGSEEDEEDEEDEIKSENDDDDEDTDLDEFTITPKTRRQWKCEHPGCGRGFKTSSLLKLHQHEHRLQTELNIHGKTFILSRLSLDDRWSCPVPDCTSTAITVNSLCGHIKGIHESTKKQRHKEQQSPSQITRYTYYFRDVDDFYVNGVRCGYHNTIGVFICYECRLVPECLLTHLQQKHGFDEKSIDNSALPESAVTANVDPNVNQHTSNPLLASAISQPYQQLHRDIVQGWLCVTSDCGYCGYSANNKKDHRKNMHQGEQNSIIPALVLRVMYANSKASYFLIIRMDRTSGAVAASGINLNWHKLDYNNNGLNNQDENEDDISQNETTDAPNQKKQWKCELPDCGQLFNSTVQLAKHRREHKLEVMINIHGTVVTLSRLSSGDRWACPIPDCETTCKTVHSNYVHILNSHSTSVKQKRAKSEDEDNQQQQSIIKKRQFNFQYLMVDDFYVSGVRYGYHTATGLFICYECRLVPECLLTHVQQKHGYDEKSIENEFIPESAVNASVDPNINQHTNNPHLASAVHQRYQQHHPDIVQGWLCITSNCGYCCSNKKSRNQHQYKQHKGKPWSTVSAFILQLLYGKSQTKYLLITQLSSIANSVEPNNLATQYNNECDDDDGDDELVLSDYSD